MLNTFYLRIACDQLHLTHLESGRERRIQADPPFSNPRLLVADFSVAERLITQAVKDLMPGGFFAFLNPAPTLLVHPLERLEGRLSQVEERLLLELGKGAGARKVALHVGDRLDADGVRARLRAPCA